MQLALKKATMTQKWSKYFKYIKGLLRYFSITSFASRIKIKSSRDDFFLLHFVLLTNSCELIHLLICLPSDDDITSVCVFYYRKKLIISYLNKLDFEWLMIDRCGLWRCYRVSLGLSQLSFVITSPPAFLARPVQKINTSLADGSLCSRRKLVDNYHCTYFLSQI